MRARGSIVMLLVLMLTGCALHSRVMNAQESFHRSLDDYLQRLRWVDLQGAEAHFDPQSRSSFADHFVTSRDLHITDVRMERAEYREDEQLMDTWVVIEYYLLPSMAVKSFGFPQQWRFFPGEEYGTGVWRITSHFPTFPPPQSP